MLYSLNLELAMTSNGIKLINETVCFYQDLNLNLGKLMP